jgi:hypothetical protein
MTFDNFINATKSLAIVLSIDEYKSIRPLLQRFYTKSQIVRIDDFCEFKPLSEKFLLCNPYKTEQIITPMMYINAVTFIDRVSFKNITFKHE